MGYWMRSGIDPIKAIRKLKDRLITVQMHDLHEMSPEGHDVPWGTGVGKTRQVIEEMHRLGITPTMFGLEYSYDWFDSMPAVRECIEFFNKVSMELAG
jgi:sugar phosphate isomerase/epimerase